MGHDRELVTEDDIEDSLQQELLVLRQQLDDNQAVENLPSAGTS
jgi:hypothetical protein